MTKIAKVVVEDDSIDSSDNDAEPEKLNSSDSDSHSDSDIIDEESKALLNEGWADSIAKILKANKPKKKKSIVLSRAKKLTDPIKKVQIENYEIATIDGQVRQEQTVVEEKVINKHEPPKKKKRELPNLRLKPNILEKDRERTLQKIATKGVVQLFNAVKMQQKDISKKLDEAGPLEVRKEKVLKNIDKRAFLDVLMGEKSSIVDKGLSKTEKEKETDNKVHKEATWNVLRDDFLMSAKMKDWDREMETDECIKEIELDKEYETD